MRAALVTIGSELMSGATVNTNAAELARRLAELGIACERQLAVSDDRRLIEHALREVLGRYELVVTTGGLGPTFDDVTMEAVAAAVGRPLVSVPSVAAQIRRFYRRAHRRLQQAALRQARLPRGGTPIANPIGTAPGLWLPLSHTLLISLPGVPAEMRAMLHRHVVPHLARWPARDAIETVTVRTVGVVELQIQHLLRRVALPPSVQVGLYPHLRAVDVRLTATDRSHRAARAALARVEAPLRRLLGASVYGRNEETLEGAVGALLVRRRKTLAIAESCTGGLLSDRITDVPGSSRYFVGGVIAYHNAIKQAQLGVPAAALARFGAVSAQAAGAMARGVRRLAGADLGLAVTGIAGPTGGTTQKPVGLVHLALADARRVIRLRCRFFGDRDAIKSQAAQTALDLLRLSLL